MIRVCSVVACVAQLANTVGFGLYALLHFTGVHRPKYDAPATVTIMAWLALFITVAPNFISALMFSSILRLQRGATAVSFSEVKRGVVKKLGRAAGIAVVLLIYPVVWVAAQPSNSFRLCTRDAYHHMWTVYRGACAMWGVGAFAAWCACIVSRVPWDTNPVVPSLLLFATTSLLLASIGLSTPVRKRLHAWLGRVGTTVEVQAAAGVAALVGTLRPTRVLLLAKERFCALPFDKLRPTDLTTNTDTGLNQKSVPMQLGQCDAFISHVCVTAFNRLRPLS
jgi:hypothetical protein